MISLDTFAHPILTDTRILWALFLMVSFVALTKAAAIRLRHYPALLLVLVLVTDVVHTAEARDLWLHSFAALAHTLTWEDLLLTIRGICSTPRWIYRAANALLRGHQDINYNNDGSQGRSSNNRHRREKAEDYLAQTMAANLAAVQYRIADLEAQLEHAKLASRQSGDTVLRLNEQFAAQTKGSEREKRELLQALSTVTAERDQYKHETQEIRTYHQASVTKIIALQNQNAQMQDQVALSQQKMVQARRAASNVRKVKTVDWPIRDSVTLKNHLNFQAEQMGAMHKEYDLLWVTNKFFQTVLVDDAHGDHTAALDAHCATEATSTDFVLEKALVEALQTRDAENDRLRLELALRTSLPESGSSSLSLADMTLVNTPELDEKFDDAKSPPHFAPFYDFKMATTGFAPALASAPPLPIVEFLGPYAYSPKAAHFSPSEPSDSGLLQRARSWFVHARHVSWLDSFDSPV